ncbi:MAG: bifunctional methylenetetrahydrofolate dehydrogenase/methenyltetrahydrofolate cyclohydrolase FolD [Chitinophagaceae bacterium]|nr:bifunctional methylenetetrahydrofolate dehydrogenase/methenyltetrahydrofolate cyclohydrolase FolD [Chitinophagaceae bacterium]
MELLDGKKASLAIKEELKLEIAQLSAEGKKIPHLAAILVGNHPASETYVAAKVKACEEAGVKSTLIRMEAETSSLKLQNTINSLNNDPDIDGILVQLPLPRHINESEIIYSIDPDKDVDGFHPVNIGKMVLGDETFFPATPYGILLLLEHFKIQTKGKHAVIIGRSNIVGRPLSILLSRNKQPGNCTVTLCHSYTENLKEICLQADILVAALGKPEFVTADMVKEGAVVIDVGITRIEDASKKSGFRLKGDVHFDSVAPRCSWITPVPGGVGPMTIAALLKNTFTSCMQKN